MRSGPPDGTPHDPERLRGDIESLRVYLGLMAKKLIPDGRGGPERASDLEQRTITTALELLENGRLPDDPSRLKAWLNGIMKNLHLAELRKARPEGGLDGDQVRAEESSPSRKVEQEEQLKRMASARDRLDEKDRLILSWKLDEKLTFKEIGVRLGNISAPAALKAYTRAVAKLKSAYEAKDVEAKPVGKKRGAP